MASVTLAESAKLSQDELVQGVIENVITVDQFFQVLPFDEIEGNALAYNRENALGDVIRAGVGTTFSGAGAGRGAATFSHVTSALTTIMGNADVNGLIQATRSNKTDQASTQIASKAKSAGRDYRSQLITGDGTSESFTGLISLCAASQKATTGATGSAISFEILDELLDLVVDKDGQVDFILMPARTIRAYKALLRALGGTPASEAVNLASGGQVIGYNQIPIFRNDYIPVNQTKGGTPNCTSIFAGTLDDGSRRFGIAGLTGPGDAAGITVEDVGLAEDSDDHIWRVKWYCGLALFNEKGLAMADGITN